MTHTVVIHPMKQAAGVCTRLTYCLWKVITTANLCEVNSFTFCTAGECTEGGGAVQHSRECSSKRDPVHDGRSICTKTRLQQTYTKTALCHV